MDKIIELLNEVDIFKTPEKLEFEGIELEVFRKIHSDKKRILAELVVGSSTIENKGISVIDNISKEVITKYAIMQYYTDIEMSSLLSSTQSKNVFELMDLIINTGLYDEIINIIDEDDLKELYTYIDKKILENEKVQDVEFGLGYQVMNITDSVLGELSENLKEGQLKDAIKEFELQNEVMKKRRNEDKSIDEKVEDTFDKSLVDIADNK